MVLSRLNITPSSLPIMSIMASIKNVRANGLDLAPDYQRGYIWSNDYKDQLIISIILNYPIGNIVINNLDHPNERNARQELVDGKQRLSTIFRFMENGNSGQWLDYDDSWYQLGKKASAEAKEIIAHIIGDSDPDGLKRMNSVRNLTFNDLPESIKINFNAYNIPVYTMQSADPAQIRNYFKVLQNQEKLRAGEIIHAMPDNPLSQYFYRAKSATFSERVCGTYERADLEKIYYTMIGLWSGKLVINSSDRNTINFVEKLQQPTDQQVEYAKNVAKNIDLIASMPHCVVGQRSNKRTAKILFGLGLYDATFYESEDVLNRVQKVCELSTKLAAFNSSESEEASFAKYFGDEYLVDKNYFVTDRAPMYRTMFSASSRSTAKDDFIRAISLVRTLIIDGIPAAQAAYMQRR